jgi:hypothetical protein
LVEKTIEKTNSHWRIDKTPTPTVPKNQSSSNIPQNQPELLTQIQLSQAQQTTIPFHITSQQFKKIKLNDIITPSQIPKMMILKSNSCRFDTFLAWLFFLVNTDEQDLLKKKDLRCHPFKILNEVIELMKKAHFEDAQTKFLNHCKTSKIDENTSEMGNYFVLIKHILKDKFNQFQIEYEQTAQCTSKKCSLNSSKKIYIESPYSVGYLEEYRNKSKGILENLYHIAYIQTKDENTCSCNLKKTNHRLVIDKKIVKLPKFLILNLESCFDENNVFKSNLIDQVEIEETFSFTFHHLNYKYELISIVLFENKNH